MDVAHGLIKKAGLPDYTKPAAGGSMGSTGLDPAAADRSEAPEPPYWGQDGVHAIYRDWRRIIDDYGREAVLRRRGLGRAARQACPLGAAR